MGITFGDKLKNIRLEKKLSQEEFANLLGTSKQVISRYETNQRTPKITIAQEYADKLSIPLNFLIDDNISDISDLSTTESLTDKIKKLPTDKQKEVEKVVDAISSNETMAAHRSDDPMNELPEEARKSIEDFKKFIFDKHGIKYN